MRNSRTCRSRVHCVMGLVSMHGGLDGAYLEAQEAERKWLARWMFAGRPLPPRRRPCECVTPVEDLARILFNSFSRKTSNVRPRLPEAALCPLDSHQRAPIRSPGPRGRAPSLRWRPRPPSTRESRSRLSSSVHALPTTFTASARREARGPGRGRCWRPPHGGRCEGHCLARTPRASGGEAPPDSSRPTNLCAVRETCFL